MLGVNARLDELQAAILRVKLHYLDQWNAMRQLHASFYSKHLKNIVETIPVSSADMTHVYYVYVVQVQKREHFRTSLEQKGIATGIHYPVPVHLQPACACYGYPRGSLPITESIAERIVSLPMYPELTSEQLEFIVETVKSSTIAVKSLSSVSVV